MVTFATLPFSSTSNVNLVTVVNPSGAVVSSSEYLPALRYSNVALFPSNSASVTPSPSASPPLSLTPSSVLPSSSAFNVNLALPASSGIGVPPSASLSSLITGLSSILRTLPPSSNDTTPSVTALTSVTRPSVILNVNSETVEYPSGAVSSFSE